MLDKSLTFNQPATGVWYDLIFSYDGTQYATYTNGVFVSSGLETLKPSTDSTLEFGRIVSETAATRGFDGYIDTVGIWAGVPTSEDITFIMDVL
ncbi:MAG: LamG domain-containing protein [Candidatus Peribacteria bacterium]|nr:LamG domain-containing protein [Candidatus Peribacteria bacterium]